MFGDHERAFEVVDISEVAIGGCLDKPYAVSGAGNLRLALVGIHDPACDGVVGDKGPRQRFPYYLCRLFSVPKHMDQVIQVPETSGISVHGRKGEVAGRCWLVGGGTTRAWASLVTENPILENRGLCFVRCRYLSLSGQVAPSYLGKSTHAPQFMTAHRSKTWTHGEMVIINHLSPICFKLKPTRWYNFVPNLSAMKKPVGDRTRVCAPLSLTRKWSR